MEYLKKYLLKGQYSIAAGSMYWLNVSRFFTNSQSLLSDKNKTQLFVSKGPYEFAGVIGENGDYLVCIEPPGPPPMALHGVINT
jgi:hypothetical protein